MNTALPGMSIDQWLSSITIERKRRIEKRQKDRLSSVEEFEAVMARVRAKRDPDRPEPAEKAPPADSAPAKQPHEGPKQECRDVAKKEAPEPVVEGREASPEVKRSNLPALDQVAKIAKAMNTIADWMSHVDANSADTSRVVLEHQERTARILVTAVSSVSKRLVEIEQQVKALEGQIAGAKPRAETDGAK